MIIWWERSEDPRFLAYRCWEDDPHQFGVKSQVVRNPYTFAALCRRYEFGRDVPAELEDAVREALGYQKASGE